MDVMGTSKKGREGENKRKAERMRKNGEEERKNTKREKEEVR